MTPLASIEAGRHGGSMTIRVQGEIDASNAAAVAREMWNAAQDDAPLHVDLTELTFIDSAGLRMLRQLERARPRSAPPLKLTIRVDSTVAQLLEITALDRVLDVVARER